MKLSRSKLISDLDKVLPGISTGNKLIEGTDTIVFSKGNIYSYNQSISVIVKESEERGLNGIVKAEDFYNCIINLPSDEIEFETEENVWKISDGSKNINVVINLLPKNDIYKYFQDSKIGDEWMNIDGEDFNRALKTCLIRKNTTKFEGVYVEDNVMYSTNQLIINKFTLKDKYPTVWISSACVLELAKWNNFNAVQYDKEWVHFRSADDTVFSIRTLNVYEYPIKTVIAVIETTKGQKVYSSVGLSDEFYAAIKRASAFSSEIEEHETITIDFGKEVSIKGSRKSGSYKEVVKEMSTDEEFELNFDISHIMSCEGIMSKLNVVYDKEINFEKPVRIVLENDSCCKIFSTVK